MLWRGPGRARTGWLRHGRQLQALAAAPHHAQVDHGRRPARSAPARAYTWGVASLHR